MGDYAKFGQDVAIPEQRVAIIGCAVDSFTRITVDSKTRGTITHQHRCILLDVDHVTDHVCSCGRTFPF